MKPRDRMTDLLRVLVELNAELAALLGPEWQPLEDQLLLLLRELQVHPDRRGSTYTRILLALRNYPRAHERVVEMLEQTVGTSGADRSALTEFLNELLHPSVTRHADIDYPSSVSVHRLRFPVVVVLRQIPSLDTQVSATMDVQSGTPVWVAISAPQFEIVGSFQHSILVPQEGDSTPAVFFLRPRELGRARLTFEFIQNGCHLGTANGTIDVVDTGEEAHPGESDLPPVHVSAVRSEPSLILSVDDEVERGEHALTVSLFADEGIQRFDKVPLHSDPLEAARRLFEVLKQLEFNVDPTSETALAVERMLSRTAVQDLAKRIGHELWNSFLPRELKDLYRENRAIWKDRPLLIVSDEPYIPWELVWPYGWDPTWEDQDPWCMTFRMSRWLRRNERGNGHFQMPDALALTRAACLAPTDSRLPAAQTERAVFKDLLRQLHAEDRTPALSTREHVMDLLENGDYDWLHAATHGTFSLEHADVDSAIWLQDGYPLTPLNVTGAGVQGHIKQVRPGFVFNACHSARQSWTVAGLGGWANHLISSGASAFVAPMWPVHDEDALEFTRSFYAELRRGQTIADALRATRARLRAAGTTAWLAYAAWAKPSARLIR